MISTNLKVNILPEDTMTWIDRVQKAVVFQLMDQMTEALIDNYIQMMDDEDFRFRGSNPDRAFAKVLCYTYRSHIQFKRELPDYIRRHGAQEGRQMAEDKFKTEYPFVDFTSV